MQPLVLLVAVLIPIEQTLLLVNLRLCQSSRQVQPYIKFCPTGGHKSDTTGSLSQPLFGRVNDGEEEVSSQNGF